MENLRSREDDDGNVQPNISLLQNFIHPQPPHNTEVTYAQIRRPVRDPSPADNESDRFDFRLQTPQGNQDSQATVTSGRSSISSGYIDLTQNISKNQKRNFRPTSPETSF